MAVIIKGDNGTVTDTYLELIGSALEDMGESVRYEHDYKKVFALPKNELIVTALSLEAFHLILHGHRRIILWLQGIAPEENYLVRGSRIRQAVFNLIEWFVVRHVDFMLFVSESMKKYVLQKYKMASKESRTYCMPCMNTELHPESFLEPGKYDGPTFAYVGSMTPWQSFEETADLYAKIERSFDYRSKFLVFTGDQEKASKILRDKGIKHYSVDYIPNEKLPTALAGVKYGFILRKDNIVNRVATPTKISTYLSSGVIPIYSRCLEDFDAVAQNMTYVVSNSENIIDKLKTMEALRIDPEAVLKEYREIFDTYYNRQKHKEALKVKLRPVYEKISAACSR